MPTTTKTQTGKSNLTATTITPQPIYLNGKVPHTGIDLGTMGYRIGDSDRDVSQPSNAPDDFVVLNQANGNVFISKGNEWYYLGAVDSFDQIDPTLIPAWYNTVPSGPVGYRVGNTDRTVGSSTDGCADGFIVLNLCNGNVFTATGGVWAQTGTFSTALMNAWLENEGSLYTRKPIIYQTGTARVT